MVNLPTPPPVKNYNGNKYTGNECKVCLKLGKGKTENGSVSLKGKYNLHFKSFN